MDKKPKGDITYNEDDYIGAETAEVYGEDIVAPKEVEVYNTVRLVNLLSATVKLPGSVTGELYIWERSGAVVEVDERDAPDLLAKTFGKPCCGSTNVNRVFELAKE